MFLDKRVTGHAKAILSSIQNGNVPNSREFRFEALRLFAKDGMEAIVEGKLEVEEVLDNLKWFLTEHFNDVLSYDERSILGKFVNNINIRITAPFAAKNEIKDWDDDFNKITNFIDNIVVTGIYDEDGKYNKHATEYLSKSNENGRSR